MKPEDRSLGDFCLHALEIERARFVAGFARALTVPAEELRELAG